MVELRKVVEALEADPETTTYYYDRECDCLIEGNTCIVEGDERRYGAEEPFDTQRYILIDRDKYLDVDIMDSFTETVEDPAVVRKLECAANRHGACRHFQNAVIAAGLEREWTVFRNSRYKTEARHICEAYGIPYE